jgi:hypothetical protein
MTPEVPKDSIGRGVLRALPWQIGAIVVTIPLFCTVWGLVQWIALVPVYLSRRKKGYRQAAKGVLIAGFVGMLLNATCAALILGNLNPH